MTAQQQTEPEPTGRVVGELAKQGQLRLADWICDLINLMERKAEQG